MTTPIERVSLPLTSPLLIAALLFSTSACSNPATVNTSNNVPEQKESQTSKADMRTSDAQVSADKPEFTTKAVATFDEPWAMTAQSAQTTSDAKNRRVIHCRHGDG